MNIFIDPGHSGPIEPGACNNEMGLTEADITLGIGLTLWPMLEDAGHNVLFSRGGPVEDNVFGYGSVNSDDQLFWRASKANNWSADLYICLHCNSCGNPQANGAEVEVAPNASREARLLAEYVQSELVGLGLADRGVKEQNDEVLRCSNMPAILIEHAFLSNPAEAALLRDRQADFAAADARGILKFIAEVGRA